MSVTHKFVSARADGPDTTLVRASNWNAAHIVGSGFTSIHPFIVVTVSGPQDGGDYGGATSGTGTGGIQEAINAVSGSVGALILITAGLYTCSSGIGIPNNMTGLTIMGEEGFGKSSGRVSASTGWTGTHIKSNVSGGALIQTSGASDARSAFGLQFKDIFFEGPFSTSSVCFQLNNVDTARIEGCTMNDFGRAVWGQFQGTTFPTAEQPGKFFIDHNEFAEGWNDYIFLDKCVQNYVHDNIFEAFTSGSFARDIWFRDCTKNRIYDNEFNAPANASGASEYIRLEDTAYASGLSNATRNILIKDNWFYKQASNVPVLSLVSPAGVGSFSGVVQSTSGAYAPHYITLTGNHIENGFDPFNNNSTNVSGTTGSSVDTTGCYSLPSGADAQVLNFVATDFIGPPSATKRVETTRLPPNAVYRNIFTPVTVYAIIGLASGQSQDVYIAMAANSGSISSGAGGTILHENILNGGHTHTISTGHTHTDPQGGSTGSTAGGPTDSNTTTTEGITSLAFEVPSTWYFAIFTSSGVGGINGTYQQSLNLAYR